jgi:AraC-like DNA-binding protein
VRRHLACRPRQKRQLSEVASPGVTGDASIAGTGRVLERRRAVALARRYREAEGLSIAQIADRLGRSSATVKAYFYDPTGEKARAVKARYQGVCRGCGAYTQPRNGKGDAHRYCKQCHPGAIRPKWTRELVLAAMLDWLNRYGTLPSSYDWSRTHGNRRGGVALTRLSEGKCRRRASYASCSGAGKRPSRDGG